MTELYIVRHAQAEGNLYRMMQGHWDGGVTELGRRQIAALAERFKDMDIDLVYSSDLFRTRLTASAALKYHDVPFITDKRLREINVGPWETRFFGDVSHDEPEAMYLFQNAPEKWQIDGAETYEDVTKRALECVNEIAENNPGKKIVISSHGVTIRCVLAAITGRGVSGEGAIPIFGNTSVSHLIYENGEYTVDYLNSTDHLADVCSTQWKWTGTVRGESFDPRTDKDFYTVCYANAWEAAHGSLAGFSAQPYYNAAVEHHLACRDAVIRIYVDDELAGLIDLDTARGAASGVGWISLVYLDERFRGLGLGIQLLGRIYALYEKLGRTSVRLHVAEDNEKAAAFYKHWGFETLAVEGGVRGKLLLMEKKLGVERQ